jgi:hypothetical protein
MSPRTSYYISLKAENADALLLHSTLHVRKLIARKWSETMILDNAASNGLCIP